MCVDVWRRAVTVATSVMLTWKKNRGSDDGLTRCWRPTADGLEVGNPVLVITARVTTGTELPASEQSAKRLA